MHLVQLLLPIVDAAESFTAVHRALHTELTARFGGVTAYSRAPAHGVWQPEAGQAGDDHHAEHDDIILLEVVVETLEAAWWRELRLRLERELAQESILIRAIAIQML